MSKEMRKMRLLSEFGAKEDFPEDILLIMDKRYIPDGNSKFGAIDIHSEEHSEQSILKYRLFVDGKETWTYTMTSPIKGGQKSVYDPVWEQ